MVRKHGNGKISHTEHWTQGRACEVLYIGVPREPEDFIADAVRKGHPRDIIANLPEDVKSVVHMEFYPVMSKTGLKPVLPF